MEAFIQGWALELAYTGNLGQIWQVWAHRELVKLQLDSPPTFCLCKTLQFGLAKQVAL